MTRPMRKNQKKRFLVPVRSLCNDAAPMNESVYLEFEGAERFLRCCLHFESIYFLEKETNFLAFRKLIVHMKD
jgi:hypothetical protein